MNFNQLRQDIMVFVNTVDTMESSRELSLAKTKLQTAMMWTGTFLGASGLSKSPYKNNGKRNNVKDIEPMANVTNEILFEGENNVVVVDRLRESILINISQLWNYFETTDKIEAPTLKREYEADMCLYSIYKELLEARMWLGMELGRIRDAD